MGVGGENCRPARFQPVDTSRDLLGEPAAAQVHQSPGNEVLELRVLLWRSRGALFSLGF